MPKITYPSAADLDSAGWHDTSGWTCKLYLDPEDRCVRIHSGVGNIGEPMSAYHEIWSYLGSYGPNCVGDSVLTALEAIEDELLELMAGYRGSEWDGSNWRGKWEDCDYEIVCYRMDEIFESRLRHYWLAGDFFEDDSLETLLEGSGIELGDLEKDDWEKHVATLAVHLEELVDHDHPDEHVTGYDEFAQDVIEEYRDSLEEEDA